jgi:hypothetical protein
VRQLAAAFENGLKSGSKLPHSEIFQAKADS